MEASHLSPLINSEVWLVRTAKNRIHGPYSRKELAEKIRSGALDLQDEICPANGYWIYLHEREEIFQRLGVEVPRSHIDHDEITETQTDVKGKFKSAPHEDPTGTIELNLFPHSETAEKTAEIVIQPLDESFSAKTSQFEPVVVSSVEFERAVIWKGVAWIIVASIFIILALVYKLTQPME